jgi:hypothetical protein
MARTRLEGRLGSRLPYPSDSALVLRFRHGRMRTAGNLAMRTRLVGAKYARIDWGQLGRRRGRGAHARSRRGVFHCFPQGLRTKITICSA